MLTKLRPLLTGAAILAGALLLAPPPAAATTGEPENPCWHGRLAKWHEGELANWWTTPCFDADKADWFNQLIVDHRPDLEITWHEERPGEPTAQATEADLVNPWPIADPEPAATPEPAADPEPAATPEPAADPEPAATPEPAADPEPDTTPGPETDTAPTGGLIFKPLTTQQWDDARRRIFGDD